MKKPYLIIAILITTVLLLSIVRIFISNNIATSGVILSQIETQTKHLETDNAILSERLYSKTALSQIAIEAEKLGFAPVKKTYAITTINPVAFKQ